MAASLIPGARNPYGNRWQWTAGHPAGPILRGDRSLLASLGTNAQSTSHEGSTMSVTEKLKEAKDKLKAKLESRREHLSASAHEDREKAGEAARKAKEAI